MRNFLSLWLFFGFSLLANAQNFTVTLDPGHGGKDPGACGSTCQEKQIVLSVAKKVGQLLEDNQPDIKAVFTRKTDIFIELEQRAQIANKAKSDLFVSIHTDAVDNKRAYGATTFIMGASKEESNMAVARRENSVILLEDNYEQRYEGFDPSSVESYIMFELMQDVNLEQSIQLANYIQGNLENLKRSSRGVRQAPYWVLHRTSMPAVLVELGFISNPDEERYLKSESGQNALARTIYQAIVRYKEDFDRKSVRGKKAVDDAEASVGMEEVPESAPTGIEYRIQVLTSEKVLQHNDPRMRGYSLQYYQDKGLYKYTFGSYPSVAEANKQLKTLAGVFPGAFVVCLKDGARYNAR